MGEATMNIAELLTTAQVCREFGYSRDGVTRAVRKGLLRAAFRLPTARAARNGALLFRREDVFAWQTSEGVYGGRSHR